MARHRRGEGRGPAWGRAVAPWQLVATFACRAAPLTVDIPLDPTPASMLVRLGPADALGAAVLFDFDASRLPPLPTLAEYDGAPLEVEAVGFASPLSALGLPPGPVEPARPGAPAVGLPAFLWARGALVQDGQVGAFEELAALDPPLSSLRFPSASPTECAAQGGCVWADGDLRCVQPCPATSSPAAPAEVEAVATPSFEPCPAGWVTTLPSGCEPRTGVASCTADGAALEGLAGFPGRDGCASLGRPRVPASDAVVLSVGAQPSAADAASVFDRLFLEVGEHTLGATVSIARSVVIEGELPVASRLVDGTLRVERGGDLLLTNLRLDRVRLVIAAGAVARIEGVIVGATAPDLIVVEPGGALFVERAVALMGRGPLLAVEGSASLLDFSAFGSEVVIARVSGGQVSLTQASLFGDGVTAVLAAGGQAELTRVVFYGDGGSGRGAVDASDAVVTLTDVRLDERSEPGLVTVRGGSLAVRRISANRCRAHAIDTEGARVTLEDGVFAPAFRDEGADAVLRFVGGSVTLSRLQLVGFPRPAIAVADAELAASDLAIDGGTEGGLVVRNTRGRLERVSATGTRGTVLALTDSSLALLDLAVGPAVGTAVHLARSTSRAERVRLTSLRGEGLFATEGSTLDLFDFDAADVSHPLRLDGSALVGARLFIADAEELGLHATHRSSARLEDLVVQDTRRRECVGSCDSTPRAGALGVYCGSSATVERFRFRRLELAGAYVGDDATLLLTDGLISDAAAGIAAYRPLDAPPRELSEFLRSAGLLDVAEATQSFVHGTPWECQ